MAPGRNSQTVLLRIYVTDYMTHLKISKYISSFEVISFIGSLLKMIYFLTCLAFEFSFCDLTSLTSVSL